MRSAKLINLITGFFIISFLVIFQLISVQRIQAQDSDSLEPSEKFSREELAQMLAPVALYPDVLLSQVMMASTYPIEVIEADRWVKKNPELKDDALDEALLNEDWDPSVKALCHFPSVLALMSERISETTNIGNAFLVQEDEVMDMIQELRAKAHAQGNLASNSEQKIIVEKETIIIEPADPRVIYVPYYDPYYVYGSWWYPAYPPYYWGPSRVGIGVGISYWPGFYFGFAFGGWSYFDWHRHHIYIDVHKRPRYVRHNRWRSEPGRWDHLPRHRKGVAYRDKYTARKYGQYPHRTREFKPATRGFPSRENRNRTPQLDGQSRFNRDTARNVSRPVDRQRQVQPRIETSRQNRQSVGNKQPEQVRTDMQQQIERSRPANRSTDRMRQNRQTQEPVRIEPERLQRQQPVIPDRQRRQRIERPRLSREQLEGQRPMRSRDNVFNNVENGRMERESSTRGRSSRQGGSRTRQRAR